MKKIRFPLLALAMIGGIFAAQAAITPPTPQSAEPPTLRELPRPAVENMAADKMYVFGVFDADGDGHIGAHEAVSSAPLMGRFEEIDADGDGRISRAEWAEFFRHLKARG